MTGVTDRDEKGRRKEQFAEAGFSMLELMVVIGIITLMSVVAVPNFLTWNARYQLRQAGTEIQNKLTMARMVAMNRNLAMSTTLSLTAGGQVQIATVEAVSGAEVFPATQMMSHVTGLSPAPTTVSFTPLGLRSGGGTGNQQIVLTNSKGVSYSLRVTPRGKVDMCMASTCP